MTKLKPLLKQLFVVTIFFATSSSRAVDVSDFYSENPETRQFAIEQISNLDTNQLIELNKIVTTPDFSDRAFSGRSELIVALLKLKRHHRRDLVHRLLHGGAPSHAVPALVEAIKVTFNIQTENRALMKKVTTGSPEEARIAAYSISLIARAKDHREDIEVLYRMFATGEIPSANFRAIIANMSLWEVVPRASILEPFLRDLCRPHIPNDIRFEAAVLRLKLYPSHEGVETILEPITKSDQSGYGHVQSIAKALLSSPSLSEADLRMLIQLQENPRSRNDLRGVLSWRLLRHRRLLGRVNHLDPRWQTMLSVLDDTELDSEAALVLLNDLAAYIQENRTMLTPLSQVQSPPKTDVGLALFARLVEMVGEGGCTSTIAVPTSSAIPSNFLQAVLF